MPFDKLGHFTPGIAPWDRQPAAKAVVPVEQAQEMLDSVPRAAAPEPAPVASNQVNVVMPVSNNDSDLAHELSTMNWPSGSQTIKAEVPAGQQRTIVTDNKPNTAIKPEAKAVRNNPAKTVTSHYFSLGFAKEHGVPEAIVAKFIAFKVRRAAARNSRKAFKDEKYWYFDPITKVTERFPYFERTAVAGTLKRLETKKLIEVGRFNRLSFDRTRWYTVPQEVMDAVEKDPLIRVDLDVANISICAGVLIGHMRHELMEKPAKTKKPLKDIYIRMSPAALARSLPFDPKTIRRTLDKLAGWIVKHPTRKLAYTLTKLVERTIPDDNHPKPDSSVTNPNEKGTNPNEKWTKPYNNTLCKPLEAIGSSFGKPFKEEAQASPAPSSEYNSGRTDDKILAKEPASPQDDHSDSPSSPGIKGCAGHVKDAGDEMADPLTYDQLKAINKKQEGIFLFKNPDRGIYDQPDDPAALSASIIRRICHSFVDSLTNASIRKFQAITDMDQLVAEIKTLFLPHFQSALQAYDSEELPWFKTVKPIFFRASLEFVVNSIAALRDTNTFRCHSINNLGPFVYDLMVVMSRRLYEENEKLWQEWYEKNKKQHASVDEAKEPDPALTPAEKTRVLRSALQARNAWGYFNRYNEYVNKGRFIFNQADLGLAEKLFELNRGFCVAQLLDLIDRCTEIHYCELAPEGFDKYFRARQGHKLGWFLRHLTTIAEELDSPLFSDWVSLPKPVEGADEGEQPESAEPAEVGPKAAP